MKFGIMPKKQIKRITTMQNGNTITIYIIIIAKSFHKCTLTDNKRQGTTSMVIPRLCSFLLTVLRTPSAEPPVNKKRTQTLSHRESGSSTNCMVDGTGLEPLCRHLVAAFGALQAKKWRNICAFQPLLMSFLS